MALLLQPLQAAVMLADGRNSREEFCIPICVLPATISNNVPGTDLSIGSDTGLDVIVEVRDLLLLLTFCFFCLNEFFFCPKPVCQLQFST